MTSLMHVAIRATGSTVISHGERLRPVIGIFFQPHQDTMFGTCITMHDCALFSAVAGGARPIAARAAGGLTVQTAMTCNTPGHRLLLGMGAGLPLLELPWMALNTFL